MFNEESAMPDLPQGHDETGQLNKVQPMIGSARAVEQPSATPPGGMPSLAWWDNTKYFWKRSASGGYHLAPLTDYVADVLDRSDHYIGLIAKEFSSKNSGDLASAQSELKNVKSIMQTRTAIFQDGVETQALIRTYLQRAIIARKICGASAVSAEHRVQNEAAKPDGNVQALKDDEKGFYQSDVEKRERWAFRACYYEFIASQIADGEVIPVDAKPFAELLATRIGRSLYDDAVERGNRIKRPNQGQADPGKKLSREELLAMTA